MSLLSRPDGVQFVVQPYRERVVISKRSTLVRQIRLLSEQHGQYVSLTPLGENAIEAVFSKESGYLLGETVWTYFDKPAYLIFCERLSKDTNQTLLVVVRGHEVYLDMIIDNDKLRAELLPLMTMQETFRVITYGDVLLSQTETAGHFALPKNMVSSFEIAKEPVFKNLPALASVRLLTLLLALKSPLLGRRISPAVLIGGAVVALALVWWGYSEKLMSQRHMGHPLAEEKPNLDYIDFYTAMRTPSPEQRLNELAKTIQNFYALPGWQASAIRYEGNQYRVQLDRQGGALQWLMQWTADQHYNLNLSPAGAEIAVGSGLASRPIPKALYPLGQVMALLIDQLDRLFPNQAVSITDPKTWGQTKSRIVTINFSDASPDTLVLIGDTLGGDLPVSVMAMNVNVREGLLNGSVQLSVWGV